MQGLSEEAIQGFDLALFSAGGSTSGEWAPRFADAGAVVVDNSSRWRMHEDVPLVVAEVNPDALAGHRGIVANPNCSTMQMVVALKPLHDAAGIERLVISTYQAVSGTGKAAVDELLEQSHALLHERAIEPPGAYAHQIAFNALPHAGSFAPGEDHTDEERKLINETRKILGDPAIRVSATCVRVPVVTGHSEAVNVQTSRELSPRARPRAARRGARRHRARRPRAPRSTRWRSTPPAGTRCSSGASAATPATSARSTSGSSPTTCARARPPTPCRSPSCCTSGADPALAGVPPPTTPAHPAPRRPSASARSEGVLRPIARNMGRWPRRSAAHPRQVPARAVGRAERSHIPGAASRRVRRDPHRPRRGRDQRRVGGRVRERDGRAQAVRLGHQGHAHRRPRDPRAAQSRSRSRRARSRSARARTEPEPLRSDRNSEPPRPPTQPRRRAAPNRESANRIRLCSSPASFAAARHLQASSRQSPIVEAESRSSPMPRASFVPTPAPEVEEQKPPLDLGRRTRRRAGAAWKRRWPNRTRSVLSAVLDRLGAAHHRPFSRG